MSKTCKHPDRDVRGLLCGYPLPCPHHTLVLEERQLDAELLARLRWARGAPTITIEIRHWVPSNIHVKCTGKWRDQAVYHGERDCGLNEPIATIRDFCDELTRECHLALETAYSLGVLATSPKVDS